MRMEVITVAVVAILIAAGVVALIYLGLFVVVWGALLVMFAVDKTESPRRSGVHSGNQ
jgi:predicted membrane protein